MMSDPTTFLIGWISIVLVSISILAECFASCWSDYWLRTNHWRPSSSYWDYSKTRAAKYGITRTMVYMTIPFSVPLYLLHLPVKLFRVHLEDRKMFREMREEQRAKEVAEIEAEFKAQEEEIRAELEAKIAALEVEFEFDLAPELQKEIENARQAQ